MKPTKHYSLVSAKEARRRVQLTDGKIRRTVRASIAESPIGRNPREVSLAVKLGANKPIELPEGINIRHALECMSNGSCGD